MTWPHCSPELGKQWWLQESPTLYYPLPTICRQRTPPLCPATDIGRPSVGTSNGHKIENKRYMAAIALHQYIVAALSLSLPLKKKKKKKKKATYFFFTTVKTISIDSVQVIGVGEFYAYNRYAPSFHHIGYFAN